MTSQVPINKWIDKEMWFLYSIFCHKKNGRHLCSPLYNQCKNKTLPFAAMWMDLENIMLSEINQRKINTVYHLYVEFKKIQMNIYAKDK